MAGEKFRVLLVATVAFRTKLLARQFYTTTRVAMTDSFTNVTKVRTKLLATNTRKVTLVHDDVASPLTFSPSSL